VSSEERPDYDVVVVGAGTAGLSSALSAQEHGAKVLLLEKSPRAARGGNGRFTDGMFLSPHNGMSELREYLKDLNEREINVIDIPAYSPDDYYRELMEVSQGFADPVLCEILVKESKAVRIWLNQLGVKWDISYDHGIRVGERIKFKSSGAVLAAKGGGEGFVEMLFDIAEHKGIETRYETKAVELLMGESGKVCGVRILGKEGFRDIHSGAAVLAAGGFQANAEMRAKYLGSNWDLVKVRGARYNTGEGLTMALRIGAQPTGHWSGCHATNIDLSAPDLEGGMATARPSYIFGIMVNANWERFFDEGEDVETKTYAKIGRIILMQPNNVAFQIFDAKATPLLISCYGNAIPTEAGSIEELAKELDTDPGKLVKTVKEFNEAVQDGKFDPTTKDGKITKGISPPKSNWAQKIDTPPFRAYAVTTGITFTYGGIKTNKDAQVLNTEGNPIPGLYAVGEMMGGLFYHNYVGGSGIAKGLVFGRIAGANAAIVGRPG
jgi:tricarballylate dehydrogenase